MIKDTTTDEEKFEKLRMAKKELFEPIEIFLNKIITIVEKIIENGLKIDCVEKWRRSTRR